MEAPQVNTWRWTNAQNRNSTGPVYKIRGDVMMARGPHTSIGANTLWATTHIANNFPSKWNESGYRPPLSTYRLNWAGRTSWGWWDDWDDTVLQTQDSKFEPWRSEAEHATSRSRRLPTILTFTRGWGRNIFCFFQTAETGNRFRPIWNLCDMDLHQHQFSIKGYLGPGYMA